MISERAASLEELEAQVLADTETKNREQVVLVEKLLNQYLIAFTKLDKFTLSEETEWEYALLLLVTRGFGSIRCAFDVAGRGYYAQAAVLVRSVIGDWLATGEFDKNRRVLAAVLKGEYNLGKGELDYAGIAKRLSQRDPETWNTIQRSMASVAYARRLASGTLVGPDKKYLMLGQYDDRMFRSTCQLLLLATARMLELMPRLLGPAAEQWWKETRPVVDAANSMVARMGKEG